MIKTYLLHYSLTALAFFAIDIIWLGIIAKNLYQKHLGHLMAETVNWPAAIIFYLLFIAGILFFAVYPAAEIGSLKKAAFLGALFGVFTYATYDLTNLATLKDWPLNVTVIDIIWGTLLTATVASIGYFIVTKFSI